MKKYYSHSHLIIGFIFPVCFLVVMGCILYLHFNLIALIVQLFYVAVLLVNIIRTFTCYLLIDQQKMIIRTGFFYQKIVSIPISNINNMVIEPKHITVSYFDDKANKQCYADIFIDMLKKSEQTDLLETLKALSSRLTEK